MIYSVDNGDRGEVYLDGVLVTRVVSCDTEKGILERVVERGEYTRSDNWWLFDGLLREQLTGKVDFKPFGKTDG